jgi:hypothetical protein
MSFHTNYRAQVDRIRLNIEKCDQTSNDDKTIYKAIVDAKTAKPAATNLSQVRDIQREISNTGAVNESFFKGKLAAQTSLSHGHTKALFPLRDDLAKSISKMYSITGSRAIEISNNILLMLCSDQMFHSTKARYGKLGIRIDDRITWIFEIGTPDPTKSTVLTYLPARLGIEPIGPKIYLAFKFKNSEVKKVPRFIDSGGYSYWKPGGKTDPIEGCPEAYLGIDEKIMKVFLIEHLTETPKQFARAI